MVSKVVIFMLYVLVLILGCNRIGDRDEWLE
jgi:hypothetical protein